MAQLNYYLASHLDGWRERYWYCKDIRQLNLEANYLKPITLNECSYFPLTSYASMIKTMRLFGPYNSIEEVKE